MNAATPTIPLSVLVSAWRARAQLLRHHGAVEAAAAVETLADELAAALADAGDGLLTLEQAQRESGYSVDHLARLLRTGKLPNAGRRNAPRVRRADLPSKPGTLPRRAPDATSRAQIARALKAEEPTR